MQERRVAGHRSRLWQNNACNSTAPLQLAPRRRNVKNPHFSSAAATTPLTGVL